MIRTMRAISEVVPCWRLLCGLAVLLGMLCGGCNNNAKAPADSAIAGTYGLVSVDGRAVPCELRHDGTMMTVRSGRFSINADGTCISKMVVKLPSAATETTVEVKATYTRRGEKLTMKWERAGTTTGTIQGDTFTMINEGVVYVYEK